MADHIIPLPANFTFINQFAPSRFDEAPSKYRCVPASVSMLAQIALPGRFVPEQLEHDLYVQWAGPDVPSDTQGVGKQPVLDWFHKVGIGFIDMEHLLGDPAMLRQVIERQNEMGIPQLIAVADESHLKDALNGEKLHNWADQGLSHVFVRAGYSDNAGYGLYFEPAAPGFHQPVPISWDDSIMPARVITCVAIMPHGMAVPPADFNWLTETWPTPPPVKPVFDAVDAQKTLAAIASIGQQLTAAAAALSTKVSVLEQEL